MIVTFCGHANFVGGAEDFENVFALLEEKAKGGDITFYLGGYGSFDRFGLSLALSYKRKHAKTKIIFVTPYISEGYISQHYDKYVYDDIIYPPLENVPYKFAISKRNEWMAAEADFIVSYVKYRYGGANAMLTFAKRKGKEVFNLAEVSKNC